VNLCYVGLISTKGARMGMPQTARVIGVREFKTQASAVLREVRDSGAEFIMSLRGRPVARIEPLTGGSTRPTVDGMGNSRGAYAGSPELDWEDFIAAKKLWEPRPPDAE
jgi:antitoxin (DNA-binding transcriptional repressor) of toxin-antitoxin stability system